jgi:hypothetical protein
MKGATMEKLATSGFIPNENAETTPAETGWLLDDGILCVGGAPDYGLSLVNYHDASAIRFVRKQDAEAFARVLQGIGFNALAASTKAVEHSWS